MRKIYNLVILLFNFWRLFPVWCFINVSKREKRFLMKDEISYWGKCLNLSHDGFILFGLLMVSHKEYRNLLCYRLKSFQKYIGYFITKLLFPNLETLYIACPSIGPRLYIQHGFSTYIAAKSIGSDCWINQQVTIGYSFDNEAPVIGNGVRICAGAKVVGAIYIGDNVIVGANAVVVKNVEESIVVGGVPAKKIGENLKHKLYTKNT